jgi:hypothetical protein
MDPMIKTRVIHPRDRTQFKPPKTAGRRSDNMGPGMYEPNYAKVLTKHAFNFTFAK